jgi:hypothetical protein
MGHRHYIRVMGCRLSEDLQTENAWFSALSSASRGHLRLSLAGDSGDQGRSAGYAG